MQKEEMEAEFQPDPCEFCEGEGDHPVAMVEDFPILDHGCCSNSASTLQATLAKVANEVWQFTNIMYLFKLSSTLVTNHKNV